MFSVLAKTQTWHTLNLPSLCGEEKERTTANESPSQMQTDYWVCRA